MELKREHWTVNDGKEFEEYLLSLGRGEEKSAWEKRIINTQMTCIAVPSPIVQSLVRDISKGNYIEFIDLWLWNNFTETSIIGSLICKIKDFSLFEKYLDIYADKCDNWATCDCLKLKITDKNAEDFWRLSEKYRASSKPFVRRLGVSILFKLIDDSHIDAILEIVDSFANEKEYYVNMIVAWLLAECFAKQRDKTLEYFKSNNLNAFAINKAISKCHDSFRVSAEDSEMLKKYRK